LRYNMFCYSCTLHATTALLNVVLQLPEAYDGAAHATHETTVPSFRRQIAIPYRFSHVSGAPKIQKQKNAVREGRELIAALEQDGLFTACQRPSRHQQPRRDTDQSQRPNRTQICRAQRRGPRTTHKLASLRHGIGHCRCIITGNSRINEPPRHGKLLHPITGLD
jgi:ATP-dependent helicase YprA (DUF1998 family)